MAASDEFPRGFVATSVAGGTGTASITLPAIPGIAHVLDSFDAVLGNNGAGGAFGPQITLTSSDGTYNNYVLGFLIVAGAVVGSAEASGEFKLIAGAGASMTITYNAAAGAGITEFLRVAWHDT